MAADSSQSPERDRRPSLVARPVSTLTRNQPTHSLIPSQITTVLNAVIYVKHVVILVVASVGCFASLGLAIVWIYTIHVIPGLLLITADLLHGCLDAGHYAGSADLGVGEGRVEGIAGGKGQVRKQRDRDGSEVASEGQCDGKVTPETQQGGVKESTSVLEPEVSDHQISNEPSAPKAGHTKAPDGKYNTSGISKPELAHGTAPWETECSPTLAALWREKTAVSEVANQFIRQSASKHQRHEMVSWSSESEAPPPHRAKQSLALRLKPATTPNDKGAAFGSQSAVVKAELQAKHNGSPDKRDRGAPSPNPNSRSLAIEKSARPTAPLRPRSLSQIQPESYVPQPRAGYTKEQLMEAKRAKEEFTLAGQRKKPPRMVRSNGLTTPSKAASRVVRQSPAPIFKESGYSGENLPPHKRKRQETQKPPSSPIVGPVQSASAAGISPAIKNPKPIAPRVEIGTTGMGSTEVKQNIKVQDALDHRGMSYDITPPLTQPAARSMSIATLTALGNSAPPHNLRGDHDVESQDCTMCGRTAVWTDQKGTHRADSSFNLCFPCRAVGSDIYDAQEVVQGRLNAVRTGELATRCTACGVEGHRQVNCPNLQAGPEWSSTKSGHDSAPAEFEQADLLDLESGNTWSPPSVAVPAKKTLRQESSLNATAAPFFAPTLKRVGSPDMARLRGATVEEVRSLETRVSESNDICDGQDAGDMTPWPVQHKFSRQNGEAMSVSQTPANTASPRASTPVTILPPNTLYDMSSGVLCDAMSGQASDNESSRSGVVPASNSSSYIKVARQDDIASGPHGSSKALKDSAEQPSIPTWSALQDLSDGHNDDAYGSEDEELLTVQSKVIALPVLQKMNGGHEGGSKDQVVSATGPETVPRDNEPEHSTEPEDPKTIRRRQRRAAREKLIIAWWAREDSRKQLRGTFSLERMQAFEALTNAYDEKRVALQKLSHNSALSVEDADLFPRLTIHITSEPKRKPPIPQTARSAETGGDVHSDLTLVPATAAQDEKEVLLKHAQTGLQHYRDAIEFFRLPRPLGRQDLSTLIFHGKGKMQRAKQFYEKKLEELERSFPGAADEAGLPELDELGLADIDNHGMTCGHGNCRRCRRSKY
ncbi:hypothetical protein LTR62_005043 [Meristemomyces frigidus]|uniref:CCHC-type domain-containing protein n=1 Tax=Meristemomyces frigidus TaxID=1508187 RepID=A0AAN7TI54_9PEZI|nr:hypothetical protein LTR62_005043 [Meristemomyces frigidus]